MGQRKVDLIIVEGPSDETALAAPLSVVLSDGLVKILVMYGDITTRDGVEPGNVTAKIWDNVKAFVKGITGIKLGDLRQIIHIVDTDGVYIPDEAVTFDKSVSKTVYTDDGIVTTDPDGIRRRNEKKRRVLLTLRRRNDIGGVPYTVYFMSSNLDHVLYDKQNSTDQEKEDDAYEFAERYHEDPEGFIRFMCESDFSVMGTHKETWEFIEKGMNSVRRYTNLGNLFIE